MGGMGGLKASGADVRGVLGGAFSGIGKGNGHGNGLGGGGGGRLVVWVWLEGVM